MQRRALSSLRSVVIAIAVIVLGVLGIRAILGAGESVVVVDNSPAGTGASETEQSQRPVLEAEVPEAEEDAAPAADADSDAEGANEVAVVADETETEDPGEATDQSEADALPAEQEPSAAIPEIKLQVGSAATSLDVSPVGPVAEVEAIPESPCSVITDGTPAVGEIGFVTYHFTGPYQLFEGTSVDVIGPAAESALIPGKSSPGKVYNGRQFPFVIGGNMFPKGVFTVRSFLASKELKATCTINEDDVARPPCVVTLDGAPTRGETATVTYRTPGPYWVLHNTATYVAGRNGVMAMKSETNATFKAKVERNFVINGSMFRNGNFQVRTMFGDGAGHAVCDVS